jgi:uncharacterized protein YkwD
MDREAPTMDRETSSSSRPARRARYLVSGVVALAVLAGAGVYLARGALTPAVAPGRAPATSPATTAGCGATASRCPGSAASFALAAPPSAAATPAVVKVPPHPAKTSPSAPASSRPASSHPASSHPAAPAPTTTSAHPSGSSPPASQGGPAAAQVLALINRARSAAGLPALTLTSGLESSSSAHNLRMAGGCGLSHQCPGEPAIGNRETAAGVHWTAAGENIGEGGPMANTSAAIAQMATSLTQSMLDEKPPNDGHRQNILSKTFTHIGIAVYRDSSGTVWLTQDFSN